MFDASPGMYDFGRLLRKWQEHYERLGLGTSRARGHALRKAHAHKAPPGYTFEQLARFINYTP